MITVAVTGAAGKAGRATVRDLLDHGYSVRAIDRVRCEPKLTGGLIVDLCDLGQATDALKGCEAVVHHAAIPAPNIYPDHHTFQNNALSTYSIFLAAKLLGIPRVVWASSETTLGLPLQHNPPRYAPIDEDLPLNPRSSYALSKQLGEEMGRYFHATAGITSAALRFSNIIEPHEYVRFEQWQEQPQRRIWNLWGYIDARDVAQISRLALEKDMPSGAESFIAAADDTVMRTPSAQLMREHLPQVQLRDLPHERSTLLCIDKARRILGYQPQFSWVTEIGKRPERA